jgi:signal peptidase II
MTHIENSGMAGGLLHGYARLFGIVAVLFVAGVIYYRRKGEIKGVMNGIGFAFLVGALLGMGLIVWYWIRLLIS